jgi:hypothetical protein
MAEKILLIATEDYVSIVAPLPHTMVVTFSDGTEETHVSTVVNAPKPNVLIGTSVVIITGPEMPIEAITIDSVPLNFSDVEYFAGAELGEIDTSLKLIIAHRDGEFD